MTSDRPAAQHSLTDDDIRSSFVLTEDIVRQATGLARELAERAANVAAPEEVVAVPSAQFQTIVESLGVMHKTLMTSIDARVAADAAEQSGSEPSADVALQLSARLLKAQNGAALWQAKVLVDTVRRAATDAGGPNSVDVPAHALKLISDAVLVTENLLRPVSFAANSPAAAAGQVESAFSDRGDLGFMSNWYNSGNIFD